MGQRPVDVYSEDRVAAISSEVSAAIDAATFGGESWDKVPAALSSAFPGSWGGLYNMNFAESRLNFLSIQNMDPALVKSYAEHFAFINPWAAYWTSLKSTTVAASEDVYPARSIAKSEFYNDWLLPQDAEAAVGMKLVGERDEAVYALLHFPLSKSGIYDRAAVEIFNRVRGSFERSVRLARLIRADAEGAVAVAALLERSRCAAFVAEGGRVVREANQMATQLFSSGRSVAVRNGRCFLPDKDADARFGWALERHSKGIPTNGTSITFQTAAGIWQVTMAALPKVSSSPTGILSLVPPQRMVLVLVTDLGLKAQNAGDFSALLAFGLTPAEILFCRRLFLGETVSDAAERLGLTTETARTRLKAILQKTGTSRQGQLMLLLSRCQ